MSGYYNKTSFFVILIVLSFAIIINGVNYHSDHYQLGNEVETLDRYLYYMTNFREEEHLNDPKSKINDHKPPDQLVAESGYPAETHTIITEDGYILKIHRIPCSRKDMDYSKKRPVVFLQHGLLASSADYVLMGPEHALAYELSDAGYDVWMGNYRGNTYSTGHINDTLSKKEYWTFSWDEMAKYDLPSMLSHMQKVTGQKKFFYIGHSMGTLTYYTACNYHPWIAESTRLMVGYGPHTVVPHLYSPLFRVMAEYINDIEWLFDKIGLYDFAPSNALLHWLAAEACDKDMASQSLCGDVMFLICGYNKHEMNNTALPFIMGHTPAGTSTWNMIHYAQSVNHGEWKGLDFGSAEANIKHWNAKEPPRYNYTSVTAPVALYWAPNDWLVVPQDVETLKKNLPNVVEYKRVDEDAYTHLDFLWGINNNHLVYGPTIELMKKY